jgi:putative phage-type endonuclease
MTRVNLVQGTDEWHKWRSLGLGASDAAAILGVSPWKTCYQLWLEKKGKLTSPSSSFAMARGNRLEDEARQWFNFTYNKDMIAACYEDDDQPFLKVSLDGISPDEKELLEIKCPGRDDHLKALNGRVPKKYIPQVQMQLYVTKADILHYVSFDSEDGIAIAVKPDKAYQQYLVESLTEFYNSLDTDDAPGLVESDCLLLEDDDMFMHAARNWRMAKLKFDKVKKEVEYWKRKIVECSDDGNIMGYGIKLKRINKDGSIDYKQSIEDIKKSYDFESDEFDDILEKNRKKQIGYWKVSEEKACQK